MGLKRKVATLIERALNARIVRPGDVALLFEQEHLRRFFDYFRVDCVFDVGANVGQYGTLIRNRAAYRGPIISFEPNPDAAAVLKENTKNDAYWFVEEAALGSKCTQTTFNVTAESQLSSLHSPQITETDLFVVDAAIRRTIDVTVSTLEIELPKYRQKLGFKRPFLKMDTQGHDVEVALGAGDFLSQFVGLQSELAIKRIYANAPTYEEALEFYMDRGFVLSAFVPNNAGYFPFLIETDCIMFHSEALIDV